ncbi:MAG: hypothetical protein ACK48G_09245 [Chitinophagaceae bacterium]|jgi:hypothetical protein
MLAGSSAKKNIREYILEFLMLFFAVTLGFFAENIREYYAEREMEAKFIEVVLEDLQADITTLKSTIQTQEQRIAYEDSLIQLLTARDYSNMRDLYFFARVTSLRNFFQPSINGFQQLKNAGGLKMIEEHDLITKIQHYENQIHRVIELQELTEGLVEKYRDQAAQLFDGRVFKEMFINPSVADIYQKFQKPIGNPSFIDNNEKKLNELLIRTLYVNTNSNTALNRYRIILKEAEELHQLLSQHYSSVGK